MPKIDSSLIEELEKIEDAPLLLKEVFSRFGNRAAIGTSGQLTGSVMIDLAVQAGARPRVFTIDTLRLFPETYKLFDAIEKKYGLKVERIQPEASQVQSMLAEHGEYLFFDSKEKQELCCRIRKVIPNKKVLDTLDVWFTGLRADQSKRRASLSRFEIFDHGPQKKAILKIAPLMNWTEKELRDYAQTHAVPIHPLLNWNQSGWYYESLGCVICTTPIGPLEPRRAGRWRWFNALDPEGSKECGLHMVKKDDPSQ